MLGAASAVLSTSTINRFLGVENHSPVYYNMDTSISNKTDFQMDNPRTIRYSKQTRTLEVTNRSFEVKSRAFEVTNRSLEVKYRGFDVRNRSFKVRNRTFEVTNCFFSGKESAFEVTNRYFDVTNRTCEEKIVLWR